jgi:hypothetical protein
MIRGGVHWYEEQATSSTDWTQTRSVPLQEGISVDDDIPIQSLGQYENNVWCWAGQDEVAITGQKNRVFTYRQAHQAIKRWFSPMTLRSELNRLAYDTILGRVLSWEMMEEWWLPRQQYTPFQPSQISMFLMESVRTRDTFDVIKHCSNVLCMAKLPPIDPYTGEAYVLVRDTNGTDWDYLAKTIRKCTKTHRGHQANPAAYLIIERIRPSILREELSVMAFLFWGFLCLRYDSMCHIMHEHITLRDSILEVYIVKDKSVVHQNRVVASTCGCYKDENRSLHSDFCPLHGKVLRYQTALFPFARTGVAALISRLGLTLHSLRRTLAIQIALLAHEGIPLDIDKVLFHCGWTSTSMLLYYSHGWQLWKGKHLMPVRAITNFLQLAEREIPGKSGTTLDLNWDKDLKSIVDKIEEDESDEAREITWLMQENDSGEKLTAFYVGENRVQVVGQGNTKERAAVAKRLRAVQEEQQAERIGNKGVLVKPKSPAMKPPKKCKKADRTQQTQAMSSTATGSNETNTNAISPCQAETSTTTPVMAHNGALAHAPDMNVQQALYNPFALLQMQHQAQLQRQWAMLQLANTKNK